MLMINGAQERTPHSQNYQAKIEGYDATTYQKWSRKRSRLYGPLPSHLTASGAIARPSSFGSGAHELQGLTVIDAAVEVIWVYQAAMMRYLLEKGACLNAALLFSESTSHAASILCSPSRFCLARISGNDCGRHIRRLVAGVGGRFWPGSVFS